MEGISGSTLSSPSFLGAYFAIISTKIQNQMPCSSLVNTLQPWAEKQPVFRHAATEQNTAHCIPVHYQCVFRCALPSHVLHQAHFLKQYDL